MPGTLTPRSPLFDPRRRRLARVRLYCNGSSIASIVIGCMILCGWLFRIELLKSAILGSASVDANTALGFIFLGISLWSLLPDPPRRTSRYWGLSFAALTASLGAITLIEHLSGLNLRIDRLFFSPDLAAVAAHSPGRMPPITAPDFFDARLGFALVGRGDARVADDESLRPIRGRHVLERLHQRCQGDFQSLLLLPSGRADFARVVHGERSRFLCASQGGNRRRFDGKLLGSAMARRFLPAVLVVPIVAAWIRMRGQRSALFGTQLGLALNVTMNVVTLSLLVWLNARQLNRAEQSLQEIEEAKDVLYTASLKDELTGLYNRRGFLTFAEEQIKLACSGRRELLVVFADVDGLKGINDGYGHSEGDRALRKTAEVLLSVFRDTDVVARLGGDEFAVLALDCSPAGLVRINAHFDKVLRAVNNLRRALGAIDQRRNPACRFETPTLHRRPAKQSGRHHVRAKARKARSRLAACRKTS